MEDVNLTIAKNLTVLRKKSGLTQIQVAEKLNYSDKSVSKWEKGDCVPSIDVLVRIADFYGVKIQDIVYESKHILPKLIRQNMRATLTLLSSMSVWLFATITFVILTFIPNVTREWLAFIAAIPVFFLVITIFMFAWKKNILSGVFLSLFIWTTILFICLLLQEYKVWIAYIIGIPIQVIIVLAVIFWRLKNKAK